MSCHLGILGGGQLALYLCEAAKSLDREVSVFSDKPSSPALRFATHAVVGALDDHSALMRFLDVCDIVTYDREDIPESTLDFLEQAEQKGRVQVLPRVATLRRLKDKGLQKAWLEEQGLPTLPFALLEGRPESTAPLTEQFGDALVQKTRCGGFDGRGVQILPRATCAQLWDIPSIVEPLLAENSEISVIVARAATGNIQTFDPVSMNFSPRLNCLTTVTMPAVLAYEICIAAKALAETVVTKLDGIGTFAIEMFVTPAGKLLINEISPRVHNSGHLTMDACNVSQFEQHVRALVGMDLIVPKMLSPGAMRNILYEDALRERCPPLPLVRHLADSGSTVYWYGKEPGMTGRKMGHINALAVTAAAAVERANQGFESFIHHEKEQAE